MKKYLKNDILMLLAAGILIFIDQFTKYLISTNLEPENKRIVIWDGVFQIISHKNTGAAWGMFSDNTGALTIVTFFILALIIFVYIKIKWEYKRLRSLKYICTLVFAGAIGNMIDRIRLKYVVDFLYFELIDFPVFNIADCYITVSMILMLILIIFYYKDEDFDLLWPKKS